MKTHLAVLLNSESSIGSLQKKFPKIKWIVLPGLRFKKLKFRRPKKSFDFLLLTSKTSIQFLPSLPNVKKIICIGAKTQEAFRKKFRKKSFLIEDSNSKGILRYFKKSKASIFFPRSKKGDPSLPRMLKARGYRVDARHLYDTKIFSVRREMKNLQSQKNFKNLKKAIFLTSPSSLEVVRKSLKKSELKKHQWAFVAIGPTTLKAIKSRGFRAIKAAKPELSEMAKIFLRS